MLKLCFIFYLFYYRRAQCFFHSFLQQMPKRCELFNHKANLALIGLEDNGKTIKGPENVICTGYCLFRTRAKCNGYWQTIKNFFIICPVVLETFHWM